MVPSIASSTVRSARFRGVPSITGSEREPFLKPFFFCFEIDGIESARRRPGFAFAVFDFGAASGRGAPGSSHVRTWSTPSKTKTSAFSSTGVISGSAAAGRDADGAVANEAADGGADGARKDMAEGGRAPAGRAPAGRGADGADAIDAPVFGTDGGADDGLHTDADDATEEGGAATRSFFGAPAPGEPGRGASTGLGGEGLRMRGIEAEGLEGARGEERGRARRRPRRGER